MPFKKQSPSKLKARGLLLEAASLIQQIVIAMQNNISINENLNKKFISSKEIISKNNEDSKIHFKEIKKPNIIVNNFRNYNSNIRCITEENSKALLNTNKQIKRMTSDYFKKKNIKKEENVSNPNDNEKTYDNIELKKIKTIKNDNDKNKR